MIDDMSVFSNCKMGFEHYESTQPFISLQEILTYQLANIKVVDIFDNDFEII